MDLAQAVVIVTGASSGIGKATSLALAREGARIALAARRREALEEVAEEIRALGAECLVIPTDVTDRAQVSALAQKTISRWGHVDVLVANAGIYVRCPTRELTVEVLERSMAVNFYGVMHTVLEVLPRMLDRGVGHLVLVSSVDGRKGIPPDGPYVAAKFALRGIGDTMRQELAGTGVDVSIIYPGRVDTPLIQDLQVPSVSPKIPPERVAREIVGAIRHRRAEVIIGFRHRVLDLVAVLWPRLSDWLVRVLRLEGREIQQSPGA